MAASAKTVRAGKTLRQLLAERYSALKNKRAPLIPYYQDLSRYFLPRTGRFLTTDQQRNRGDMNKSIHDNTATLALRIAVAGFMAGCTSPARPWFRLAAPDPDLANFHPVKMWLADVEDRMRLVFSESNTYRALPTVYRQMILFGPGPMGVADDYENIIHCYPYTAGEYCMATDYRGEVNTFFREFEITVAQCVREFGEQNCSDYVKENWKNNNLEAAVTIVHAIEPRDDRDDAMLDNLNMPWRSAYFEWSTNGKDTKRVNDELLSEGGYRQFPIMAPRWDVESCGDVYGSSPAMDAAFDTKSLQHKTLREGQAIDHQTRPALQGPAALKGREIEGFPGGFTAVDGQGSTPPIQPMWQVGLRLDDMHISMQGTRDRIEAALFKPLFLMIANSSDTTQRTAAEIAAREQEKLIVLGPAVENVNGNLKALVNLTFAQMAAVGALPPAPPELQGQELGVEFISVLAQASKLIRVRPVNEWVQDVLQVGATKPEALDRLNVDEWVEGTADMRGVPPKMVVPLEEARKVREARANAQAAKEQAALVQAHAKTARDLAAAPTDQANALTSAGAGAGIGGL